MATVARAVDWVHIGRYDMVAYYVDSDNRYKVMLYANYDKYGNVSDLSLAGEINSVLDRHNMYYYDLSQDVPTNRAWLCPYKTFEEVLDYVWHVCSDIEIPSWFVERAEKLCEIEKECEVIARSIIKDANMSDAIQRYVDENVSNEFMQMHDCYLDRGLTYDVMDVLCSIMRSEKNEEKHED